MTWQEQRALQERAKADQQAAEANRWARMDPMQAIEAKSREARLSELATGFQRMHGLSPEQARRLAEESLPLQEGFRPGGPIRGMQVGSAQHKKWQAANKAKAFYDKTTQQSEDNIRQLRAMPAASPPGPAAASGGADQPYISQGFGLTAVLVPNPEWGKKHGMTYNGSSWASGSPNADLERQMKEMEIEALRQQMERQESGVSPDLRAWLSQRLGS